MSDFILKYSRSYTPSSGLSNHHFFSHYDENSSRSNSPEIVCNDTIKAPFNDSYCRSPLSAGSVPQSSPSAPYPSTNIQLSANKFKTLLNVDSPRPSKGRLRSLILNDEMEEAWTWTCKCIQVRYFFF